MAEEELFEQTRKLLKDNEYRLTPQRETILHTFIDYADRHLSAEL